MYKQNDAKKIFQKKMVRKLEGYLLRPLSNLFFTLVAINKSIYYTLNEVYIHIHYFLYNTYYTSFVLVSFENDNNATKRLILGLQFRNCYCFPFQSIC